MSKQADLSRAEVSILARMAELEPDSPRYQALDAALAFKSSWIVLGEHLAEVARTMLWRGWGYASFERYAAEELFLTAATTKKLVRGYQWLGAEAPEYLPSRAKADRPAGDLPDLNAVSVLADARRHVDEARVPEDAYLALKQAALEGETATTLRRTLKEAIPEHLRPKAVDDHVRNLRKALTACVKVIDELRSWDEHAQDGDDLIVRAEALRDAIALRLPRTASEEPTERAA